MKNLITTYCNAFKGDFMINHWLRSIREQVDLSNTDIMVIDFGLSGQQVQALHAKGVIVNKQQRPPGRMSNVQYQCLSEYLDHNPVYDQVLYSDCGDLIFQADVSHLFSLAPDRMRLVLEPDFNFNLHKVTLGLKDIRPEKIPLIRQVIGDRPTANCGFVLGPARKMASIWNEYAEICHSAEVHGTDQLVINYICYRDGFEVLDEKYNYVAFLKRGKLHQDKDGFFLNARGRIPVVHNAGKYDFARTISGFGYRQGKIKPRFFTILFSWYYKMVDKATRTI
jgi:hypothetical protein